MNERMLTNGGFYLLFDDMCWPTAGAACGDLEWTLRYGEPTRQQLLCAASVLAAYRQMVYDSREKRQRVIHMLKKYGDPANKCDRGESPCDLCNGTGFPGTTERSCPQCSTERGN